MDLISEQYSDSKNFAARIDLNRKFRTNPQPLTSWIFDQINFQGKSEILEIGCGNGILWKTNLDKIEEHLHIILTDFSLGMLKDAQKVLSNSQNRFEFKVMDAQEITYPDNYFDIVIANLMLYHVPNRKKAFSEITRVLKMDGSFYATAFGKNNMKELNDLVRDYLPEIDYGLEKLSDEFGLENGKSQLDNYFKEVELLRYQDHLEVNDSEPIINYILSFGRNMAILTDKKLNNLRKYLNEEIEDGGSMRITKDTGIFIANDPVK